MPPIPEIVVVAVLGVVAWRTGIGRRAVNIAQQKISHLMDRAEDPVEALDLSYQKQREALLTVKRGVAEVVVSEKRLEIQANQLRQSQEKLRDQAKLALQQGREDLARLALTRAQASAPQLDQLQLQIAQLKEQEQKLEETAQRLAARVENFKSQRDSLKAQYSAAQASARIGETVTGLSRGANDLTMTLERAQEKTQQMQARAAAMEDLMSNGTLDTLGMPGGDDIDRQLRGATDQAAVEAQLAQLRQEALADAGGQSRLTGAAETEKHNQEGG
jgi:phage shock protein A